MKRAPRTLFLVLATTFQVFVLTGMVALAHLPLWTGTEIRVKTQPLDPRSMFRGNYARLHYDFATIPRSELETAGKRLRAGDTVYVILKEGESGLHEFFAAALEPPAGKTFLRGHIGHRPYPNNPYRIRFGIEAYFSPKQRARELEKGLSGGGMAVLMVTEDGKAALKSVIPASAQTD